MGYCLVLFRQMFVNPFEPNVEFHIETTNFALAGFYMQRNTRLKFFKRLLSVVIRSICRGRLYLIIGQTTFGFLR